jgi:hypothetical protein
LGILFAGKITNPRDLKKFLRQAQNEFGLRIKKIRSDNGTEFKNSQIEGFLEEEGIKHELSRHRIDFGHGRLTPLATPSTDSTFTESSRKHHMNSSPVKSPTFLILELLGASALFLLKR